MRRIICYIVYGNDDDYYNSTKFSILTLLNYTHNTDIEIVVLTSNVDQFKQYPVTLQQITDQQKKQWSLDHQYHFRIKNLGLQNIIKSLHLSIDDKILFFDTDIYFKNNPLKLFDLITEKQVLLYKNEGRICDKKRFKYYKNNLQDKDCFISQNAQMWGSAVIGITASEDYLIKEADQLMLSLVDKLDIKQAHTIEQLSLAETLRKKFEIVEGVKHVNNFSTSKRKDYAMPIIKKLLKENKLLNIESLAKKALKIKINRPILQIIKDKIYD